MDKREACGNHSREANPLSADAAVVYYTLVSVRNQELAVHWSRYNVFAALNLGIAAAIVAIHPDPWGEPLLCVLGFALATVWLFITYHGKELLTGRWEKYIIAFEENLPAGSCIPKMFTEIAHAEGRTPKKIVPFSKINVQFIVPVVFVAVWLVLGGMTMQLDANWTIAVLTAILVLVTALYAYYTRQILKANEAIVEASYRQSRDANRPYINAFAFVDPVSQFLKLKLANTGKTSARELRLTLDKDFFQFGKIEPEQNLRNLYVFRNEVQTLPPGAELHFNLGVGSQIFGPDVDLTTTPKVLTLTAKYRGEIEYDDRFVIDLNQYRHSTTAGAIPLKQELDRICDQVARVGGMLGDHVTAIKALVEKNDGGQSH